MANYCPYCRFEHHIDLTCKACGKPVEKWNRKCTNCSTPVHFPWHLQIGRLKHLYPRGRRVGCPSCGEEIPSGMTFCLHCGRRLVWPKKAIEEAANQPQPDRS